jgi:hypothetical protein
VHQGHVNVTSPGVTGSPQVITVTLTINPAPDRIYMPLLNR